MANFRFLANFRFFTLASLDCLYFSGLPVLKFKGHYTYTWHGAVTHKEMLHSLQISAAQTL